MTENNINLEIWKTLTNHPRLGEILLQHKKITINQLGIALEEQKKENLPIGEILVNMHIIEKDELIEVLELQSNIDRMLNESYIEIQKLKKE
ncbi:MAG: hypothetical protein PHC34_11420 [Candidatus Gastranaerophilales bacterium]|nr:hypothetical protein [Candidatus Gastranaerophilales bacterium]